MTRKKYLLSLPLFLLLLSAASRLEAQQDPQFTQNMFNHSFVNPGHFGFTDGIAITGLFREQWLGFKDEEGNKIAPETFLVTGDAPIRFLHGGVGIGLSQDKYGFFKDMSVKLGYSYHLNLRDGKLGIGISGNFNNKSGDFSKFISVVENDPSLDGSASDGITISDLSAGIFLRKPRYYLAFSSNNMLESNKDLGGSGGKMTYNNRRHYYLTGGYDITVPAYQGYVFTPSVFLKSDGNKFQADFNAMAKYNNKVWGGVSYRLNDAVALIIGMAYKDLEIGYSYDIPTSRVGATGSHEIMARYVFKIEREKARSGYRNTRYL